MIDDPSLYERMLDSMEAYFAQVGDVGPGGRTIRRDGVLASVCPAIPDRSVFNSVVYRDGAALRESLDELAAAYHGAGVVAWTVWVPETDASTREALERAGNVLDAAPRAMAVALAEIDLGRGAGNVAWERSNAPHDMCAVLADAFGWRIDRAAGVFAWLPHDGHVYVARDGGRPVACVAALDAGDDCGIWNVGTVREARGRGLCSALMRQALNDARSRGCATTSLQATKGGRPVYARLGYRDLGAIEMWERRSDPPRAGA